MKITRREEYNILFFSLFPCMAWGLVSFSCDMLVEIHRNYVHYPDWLSGYTLYRVKYLVCAFIFLFTLKFCYKTWLPNMYNTNEKIYMLYSILSITSIVCGFFVKVKFWNYILDGCFISPSIEELIARFILYETRHHSWKLYALGVLLSSLTFSLMHIGYDPSLLKNSTIFSKLSEHFIFGLILYSIFWFFPKLSLLISVHAISNLYGILKIASKLRYSL